MQATTWLVSPFGSRVSSLARRGSVPTAALFGAVLAFGATAQAADPRQVNASPQIANAEVAAIERAFLGSDGDLRAVHGALIRVEAAWADARSAPSSKLKTPQELVVSTFRALDLVPARPRRAIAPLPLSWLYFIVRRRLMLLLLLLLLKMWLLVLLKQLLLSRLLLRMLLQI